MYLAPARGAIEYVAIGAELVEHGVVVQDPKRLVVSRIIHGALFYHAK